MKYLTNLLCCFITIKFFKRHHFHSSIHLYILITKINDTPYLFDYLSPFYTIDISTILDLLWQFQLYNMRIHWENGKYLLCTHLRRKRKFAVFSLNFAFFIFSITWIGYINRNHFRYQFNCYRLCRIDFTEYWSKNVYRTQFTHRPLR